MIDIDAMIQKEIENGYGDANAQSKVCQDIILKAISTSSLNRNVTIKGGVVMRSKTGNIRRATQDIDLDFIRYSLDDKAINTFVRKLNCLDGITVERVGKIKELKQQDYHGKRIYIKITDYKGFSIENKLDLGVHTKFDIGQEEFCFDIAYDDEGASLLINSNEQMFAEKLKSLLRFGTLSSRYKDIFDMYFLSSHVDLNKFKKFLEIYVYNDPKMREKDINGIIKRINMVFNDKSFTSRLRTKDANWLEIDSKDVLKGLIEFFNKL